MSSTRRTFTAAFKMQVLSDYYSNGCHLYATARKWNLTPQNIWRWIDAACKNQNKDVPLPFVPPLWAAKRAWKNRVRKIKKGQPEVVRLPQKIIFAGNAYFSN